jgi:hypothetical protein
LIKCRAGAGFTIIVTSKSGDHDLIICCAGTALAKRDELHQISLNKPAYGSTKATLYLARVTAT